MHISLKRYSIHVIKSSWQWNDPMTRPFLFDLLRKIPTIDTAVFSSISFSGKTRALAARKSDSWWIVSSIAIWDCYSPVNHLSLELCSLTGSSVSGFHRLTVFHPLRKFSKSMPSPSHLYAYPRALYSHILSFPVSSRSPWLPGCLSFWEVSQILHGILYFRIEVYK